MASSIEELRSFLPDDDGTGRRGITGWDMYGASSTAAQRTSAVSSIAGATISDQASALTALATAAVAAGISQYQVYTCIFLGQPTAG